MTPTAADILQAALKLPEIDRLDIAAELLASAPAPQGVLSEDAPGFLEELDRRVQEHRRDPSTAVGWRQLRSELHERYGKSNP